MIKKLLFTFLIIFSAIVAQGQQITLTTTSISDAWSPTTVSKTGSLLHWEATNSQIGTITEDANKPSFDFLANDGSIIDVIITSADGFSGLTNFRFLSSQIETADFSVATNLTNLFLTGNNLTTLDVSRNAALTRLLIADNNISTLDISNNPLIDDLRIDRNNLSSSDLDAIVNTLDAYGLTNGNLQVNNNAGGITTGAQPGYDNLIAKGWTIDVSAPVSDIDPPVIGVLNAPTNVGQTSLTLSWTAATDNVGVTNYKVFQDNVEIATLGNILTYNVTGLVTNTNYDFHITALDNEANESANSNTQNVTTAASVTTMTLTTTSTSVSWSPTAVSNSGATLRWTASGPGITTQVVDADVPAFNLQGNSGIVNILVESSDGFNGVTNLRFIGLQVETVDFSAAANLSTLFLTGNNITTIDLSGNAALTRLLLADNNVSGLVINSNPLIDDLRIDRNNLSATDLDAIVNNLDAFGLSGGNLQIANNAGSLTSGAQPSYDNLIGKSWAIDVTAPIADTEPPVIGTLNVPTNVSQTSLTLDWTAATDNVGVTNYKVFQDNAEIATIGNVLTYDVTGLTTDTNYDFHITALDNSGNESANSNTQNVTTIPNVSSMTLTTTSTSTSWTPTTVSNSGATLKWTANGGGITEQVITANVPSFNLENNNGTVNILVESTDGFAGLTNFRLQGLNITSAELSNGIAISTLYLFSNQLTALDISNNTALSTLRLNGGNSISALDISNNTLLTDLRLQDNDLPSGGLDAIINNLDAFGLSNGNLQVTGNTGSLTSAAQPGYDNLIGKTWTIDVTAPPIDNEAPVIGVLNVPTNVLQTTLSLDWTAATDNVGVTNYRIFQDNVEIATIGNLLTYDVTGLTADTNYDFHITALDNEGNESANSNTQNITTIPDVSVMTFLTTSVSGSWSPAAVSNPVSVPHWVANGGGIVEQTFDGNIPSFDLQNNSGTVTVTMESTDGFAGLTNFRLHTSDVTSADVSNGVTISTLWLYTSLLTTVDVSNNIDLVSLRLHNSPLFTTLDISNNPLLTDLRLSDDNMSSASLDAIVNQLDVFGLTNGTLNIINNAGSLTSAAQPAYDNLVAKGWTIDVPAPPSATGPEIDITGLGISIPGDGTNIPDVTDDTDFGFDVILNPIVKTFTILNTGVSDLILTDPSPFVTITGTDAADFTVSAIPVTPIIAAGSTSFDITFSAASVGVKSAIITVANNDVDEPSYSFNIQAEATAVVGGPEINVTGNGITIINGNTPDLADGTDYGQVKIGVPITKTFTIENNGDQDLTISLAIPSGNFDMNPPFILGEVVGPGASTSVDLTFDPSIFGVQTGTITINSDDADEGSYVINVTAEGVDNIVSGDIMITQYYEGTSDSKWIEIKNVSGAAISAGTYFLALYDQTDIPNITTDPPTESEPIPALFIDEVLLFKNAAASLPLSGNLGTANIIVSPVCNFDGNDAILISTADDATCYSKREDIVGDGTTSMGNQSYIRGGNSNEIPELDFDVNNWLELSPSADVDLAISSQNIALGTQATGKTIWNGSWDNSDPDKTRNVEIASNYTAVSGNIDAYSLMINSGVDLDFDEGTTNTVTVNGDLIIDGTFIIGDQESLLMTNENSTVSGSLTKLENSIFRNNSRDFTYWTSPVINANISTVFAGVTPGRIFKYDQSKTTASDPNNDPDGTFWDAWIVASGIMDVGLGFAAEGPTGSTGVHNLTFTGVPHNGTYSFDIYSGNVGDGDDENDYSLVGNPYPSAIDVTKFFDGNGGLIRESVYFWTHNTPISGGDTGDFISSDYAVRNRNTGTNPNGGPIPDINIGSSQGFLVKAIGGGLLRFTNGMRIPDANDQFYKSSNSKKQSIAKNEKDIVWLNIETDQGGINQIAVSFSEFATDADDNGYDTKSKPNSDNPISLYSVLDNNKYVIQTLGTFSPDKIFDLGFYTKVAPRTLTISMYKAEGVLKDADVYLVDKELNITHNLRESDYQFVQSTIDDNPNRFTLQFSPTGSDIPAKEIAAKSSLIVSNNDDNLRVNSNKVIETIKVYDLFGRMIIINNPKDRFVELETRSIKPGTVLIIEATLEDGTIVNKKTIKY